MEQVSIVESAEGVLIVLYGDKAALERLLTNAGLAVAQFDLGDTKEISLPMLNRCLRIANDQGKLYQIFEAAIRDYPHKAELRALADRIEFYGDPATGIAISVRKLSGFLGPLRRSRHVSRSELNKLDSRLQKILDMTAMEESDRRDPDIPRDQWDDLNQNLRICAGQLQLYRELMDLLVKPRRVRMPGSPDERVPPTELVAERTGLIDAKMKLFEALLAVVRSGQDIDVP